MYAPLARCHAMPMKETLRSGIIHIYIYILILNDRRLYEIFPRSATWGEKAALRWCIRAELERLLSARSASMAGFLRFIIYRVIYGAVKGWRGVGWLVGWRNPRDAIAMNMESGEQRERRFYECSGECTVRSGLRSHDTGRAIFAMLIIPRDFIIYIYVYVWRKASKKPFSTLSLSPVLFCYSTALSKF